MQACKGVHAGNQNPSNPRIMKYLPFHCYNIACNIACNIAPVWTAANQNGAKTAKDVWKAARRLRLRCGTVEASARGENSPENRKGSLVLRGLYAAVVGPRILRRPSESAWPRGGGKGFIWEATSAYRRWAKGQAEDVPGEASQANAIRPRWYRWATRGGPPRVSVTSSAKSAATSENSAS